MSTVMESQALTDLMARGGASDTDREAWLAERHGGCTATQARDLKLGVLKPVDLAKSKLSGELDADLYRVPVIGWGKDREPVIAETLRGEGIEPEQRVFHHADNSRYLASPDGIGVGFDGELVVSEIKTTGEDLWPGSKAYDAKGYEWQMQWVMFVTGAARCRFVVEERISGPVAEGERQRFSPGEMRRYWVERDEAKISELVLIVDAFLAELDRMAVEGLPEIDEEIDTDAVNYLRASDEIKKWTPIKEDTYRRIVAAGKSQESDLARVTYTPAKPGEVTEVVEFDEEAAREARADLWAKVHAARTKAALVEKQWAEHLEGFKTTREVVGKGRPAGARITAGKSTKEQKA